MRIGRYLVFAVFGLAALASWFVVRQLPLAGERAPIAAAPAPETAPAPARATPPLEHAPAASDGVLEVRATAGGEPVRGASVVAYLERAADAGGAPEWRVVGRGVTGADAIARLPAAPGPYLVAVRAPGLAPAHAEAIRAAGEPATPVDVALQPAVALDGAASDPSGAPLRARVTAIPLPSWSPVLGAPAAPPEEEASAEAAASGLFRLDGLAPGSYAVRAEAPGRAPVLLPRIVVPRAGPLAIRLAALGAAEGVVLGPDGRPVAGATVWAIARDGVASATSGEGGAFSIAAPSGTYQLLAAKDGLAAAPADAVAVAPGAAQRGVSIRLAPAGAVDGAVTGPTRAPAAGAVVVASPHGTGEAIARATAGADGRYRLAGLAPGAWDLRFSAPGLSPAQLGGVAVGAGRAFRADVALAGTGAVEGVVHDLSGRAMAGVRVRVVSRGDGLVGAVPVEARTDFDGRWRIAGLEAGRAELVARQEGVGIGVSQAVRVESGRSARVDLVLAEPGTLAGRVAAPDGTHPPLGTVVIAVPMRAGLGTLQLARAIADASGNYRMDLPAGEYRVHAAPGDALRTDLRVAPSFASVATGGTTRLDLTVSPVAPERGTTVAVLEPGGAPSPGAIVTVSRAGDDRIALATSAGEDGRVVLASDMGLAGASITVRARSGGRTGSWTGVAPADGEVVVRLAPGAALTGVVRARGAPIAGFTLDVASQPVEGGWRTLDEHRFSGDRFELADLPPEPLRLTVRTADGRIGSAETTVASGKSGAIEIPVAGR